MKDLFIYRYLSKDVKALFDRGEVIPETIGRSGNFVYSLGGEYYIKCSRDSLALENEREREIWLEGRLIAPKVVDFHTFSHEGESWAYLVTTAVKGDRASDSTYLADPERLIDMLAEAMAAVHALDTATCPFLAECGELLPDSFKTVCHGDFCLPNIIVTKKGFQGFVDVGDLGVSDPWLDYAWCLWSLSYNLKTEGYRDTMLEKLGIKFDEAKYRAFVGE